MARRDEIVVGLDIGTTKVCCVVGQATDEGIDIIGIGSHPSNDLVLDDPAVSRFHCELKVTPAGVWVEDTGSSNGTWLDGVLLGRA